MKSVFVIHRHGARFPSRGQPKNLSFPDCDEFWSLYNMQLTPKGMEQLKSLGKKLRHDYPELLDGDIQVFSSNTSRTILSGISTLNGLIPDKPYHIEFGYDRGVNISGSTRVRVEKKKFHDSLFHLGKDDKNSWRKQNIAESDIIKQLCSNQDVIDLLDKIYTITHCSMIDPCKPLYKRLSNITSYVNLVRYGRIHSCHILPNILGIELTEVEKDMIIELGNVVYGHHFGDHSNSYPLSVGINRCAMLLDEICRRMLNNDRGIYIYSAHDTTLLSLAAGLGLKIPCPDFASYFIFELSQDGKVNVKCNPQGTEYSVYWDRSEELQDIKLLKEGSFLVDDFVDRFSHPEYRNLLNNVENLPEIVYSYFSRENEDVISTYGRNGQAENSIPTVCRNGQAESASVPTYSWNESSYQEIAYRFS